MPRLRRSFDDCFNPEDASLTFDPIGNTIMFTAAFRPPGAWRFERIEITLDHQQIEKLIISLAREIGVQVFGCETR